MMKTIITACMAMVALSASAQIDTNPTKLEYSIDGIGRKFVCNPEKGYLVNYHPNDDEEETCIMTIYDEELNVVKTIMLNDFPAHLRVYDFDDNPYDYDLVASQTLFNDDEKFEYVLTPGAYSDSDTEAEEINIVSEDGTVLQSLTVPANRGYDIVIVGNNRYLSIVPNDDGGVRYMYKINKSTDLSKVSIATTPTRMSVSPRLAERNQDITVVAGGSGVREIAVTNAGGQVVYSTKVAAGENTVIINSNHLSSGLNVVSVKDANGKHENCKVIVKK